MSGEYLMCCRSYSRDHDVTTSSYCIISCSGKKSPEIASHATVLWAKHDSSEHFLNNGEPDENANQTGASGCGSREATVHHFTLCHSPHHPHPPLTFPLRSIQGIDSGYTVNYQLSALGRQYGVVGYLCPNSRIIIQYTNTSRVTLGNCFNLSVFDQFICKSDIIVIIMIMIILTS